MMECRFLNEFQGVGCLISYVERKAAAFLAAKAETQFNQCIQKQSPNISFQSEQIKRTPEQKF